MTKTELIRVAAWDAFHVFEARDWKWQGKTPSLPEIESELKVFVDWLERESPRCLSIRCGHFRLDKECYGTGTVDDTSAGFTISLELGTHYYECI